VFTSSIVVVALFFGLIPSEPEYLSGAEAEEAGQYARALQAFQGCAERPGPLSAFARVRLARCRAKSGDVEGAIQAYQNILVSERRGAAQRMARLHLARLLKDLKRHREAAPLFAEGLNVATQPWWMQEYAFHAAEAWTTLEPAKLEHYAHFRTVVSTTLYVRPRLDAARKLAASPDPEDKVLAVSGLLRSDAIKEAAAILLSATQGLTTGTGQPLNPVQLQNVLENGTAKSPEALPVLQDLMTGNAESPWLRAWLYYGVCLAVGAGRLGDVALLCDGLVRHCPDAMETGEALWKLADYHQGAGNAKAAADAFERLAATNLKHRLAPFALFHVGRLRLAAGGIDAALPAWELLARTFPEHTRTPEAWYAAAQYCRARGHHARAREFLTRAAGRGVGDYFAHRAFAQVDPPAGAPVPNLRIDGENTVLRPFPVATRPPAPLPSGLDAAPSLQRFRFFASNGLEEGEWEALELCESFQGHPCEGLIYRVVAEAGAAHTALECAAARGWGIQHGKKTLDRLRLEYPLAYWPTVRELASQFGIDPYLILAVARQESTFRPGLVSHAGATGVMQVMPGTARYVAKIEPSVTPEDATRLKHPMVSLRLGGHYLLRMIERSAGRLLYALASYNAGPGNCAKWQKAFAGHDHDAFVAAIPFTETRDYVKKILANYAAFRSLYPEN